MMIWEQLQALTEGDPPEKKAAAGGAGSAGGGKPPGGGGGGKCEKTGLPKNQCAHCSGKAKTVGKTPKSAEGIDIEMNDLAMELKRTRESRTAKNMDFKQWHHEIEEFLKHVLRNKEKGETNFNKFKEAEKEAAYTAGFAKGDDPDVTEYRKFIYSQGVAYDDYIGNINKMFSKKMGLWHGLRGRIFDNIAGERFEKKKGKDMFGAEVGDVRPADVERDTVEFQEFEKWAKEMWQIYGQGVEFDQQTWDETLHYFASSGQRFGTPDVDIKGGTEPGAGPPEGPGVQVSRQDTTGMAAAPAQDDRDYWEKMLQQRQAAGKLGTLKESVWLLIIEALETFGVGDKPGEAFPPIQSPQQKAALPPMTKAASETPLYKKLMAMDRGQAATHFMNQYKKRLQSNKKLAAERQAMIDRGQQYPTPPPGLQGPELEKWKKLQQVRGQLAVTGEPTKQIDPDLFKKKRAVPAGEREKRKFPTWWDPFGFKGGIPYTEM